MMEYRSASSSVRYVAGGYYLYGIAGNTIWPDEYLGASVTAINGEDPGEFIVNNPFNYSLEYDDIFEYTYRSYVLFNNEAGTEVVIDIELEDGTTAQVKTFMDSRRELALLLGAYASNFTSNSSVSVVKDNYELVEEEDYIYLRINSCEKSDEDAVMIEALKDALTRHDKIIIDLRDNGGGLLVYFSDCVYPYIFEESFSVETLCSVEKNELSTLWLKDYLQ